MTEAISRHSAYPRLFDRAVHVLAMHNHSEQELRRKLAAPVIGKNGPEEIDAMPEDYDKVTAWCIGSRYLNDGRFVQQFIASHSRRGYGPARARQGLNQRGIARETIEWIIRECEIDQAVFAREQTIRKYGELLPVDPSDRIKIQHFLFHRGYLMGDIRAI